MSERHEWSDNLSDEELARCRRLAESVIRNRKESLHRLEAFREEARASGLSAVEEFLFQAAQSDQRILGNAEQLFSSVVKEGGNEAPPRDHLVDDEVAESFPASDPPTYSRIT